MRRKSQLAARRVLRTLASALFATTLAALLAASCNSGEGLLRAKQIEHLSERVGGPVAMADVGDFLLENDQIRVAILRSVDSPGPGVFGGSLVDIDIRRPRIGAKGGEGRDRFAESFPLANLLVPEPTTADVRVLKDGSDGKEASIRVEGEVKVSVALSQRSAHFYRKGQEHTFIGGTNVIIAPNLDTGNLLFHLYATRFPNAKKFSVMFGIRFQAVDLAMDCSAEDAMLAMKASILRLQRFGHWSRTPKDTFFPRHRILAINPGSTSTKLTSSGDVPSSHRGLGISPVSNGRSLRCRGSAIGTASSSRLV